MEEKFIDQDIFSHCADGQYLIREKGFFLSVYRERGMVLSEEKFKKIEDGLKDKLKELHWWLWEHLNSALKAKLNLGAVQVVVDSSLDPNGLGEPATGVIPGWGGIKYRLIQI